MKRAFNLDSFVAGGITMALFGSFRDYFKWRSGTLHAGEYTLISFSIPIGIANGVEDSLTAYTPRIKSMFRRYGIEPTGEAPVTITWTKEADRRPLRGD